MSVKVFEASYIIIYKNITKYNNCTENLKTILI